jgi:hypothetical protein
MYEYKLPSLSLYPTLHLYPNVHLCNTDPSQDALSSKRDPRARVEADEPRADDDGIGYKLSPMAVPHGNTASNALDPPT